MERKGALGRRGPIDRHRLQSPEMLGGKLEGFAPNLLVKFAPVCHQHQVGWRHYLPREGHEASIAFPLATFAFAFTLAGMGKGTLLARRARQRCRQRCRRQLLLCCFCGRLEILKGKTFTTSLALAALALGILGILA